MFNRKVRETSNIIRIPKLKSNVIMFNINSIVGQSENTNKSLNRMKIVTSRKKENYKLNISNTIITYKNIKTIKLTSVYVDVPEPEQGDPATLNEESELLEEVLSEIDVIKNDFEFIGSDPSNIEVLNLENTDLSYGLIVDQSGSDILFKTHNLQLTGIMMYFDNAFELPDSMFHSSTNRFKESYVNEFNQDLSGWYIAYNSSYNNSLLNSNMIIIMWTVATNGIRSSSLDGSNVLLRLPTNANTNLLWIDQIADQSANDVTEHVIFGSD